MSRDGQRHLQFQAKADSAFPHTELDRSEHRFVLRNSINRLAGIRLHGAGMK